MRSSTATVAVGVLCALIASGMTFAFGDEGLPYVVIATMILVVVAVGGLQAVRAVLRRHYRKPAGRGPKE